MEKSQYALFLLFFVGLVAARIKECLLTVSGADYMGKLNTTVLGHTCQRWDQQSPQTHTWNNILFFPDPGWEEVGNGCRSPDEFSGGPWCYTTTPGVRWDQCYLPECHDFPECKRTALGTEYQGSLDRSSSGQECLDWTYVEQHLGDKARAPSKKPVYDDSNYCRNPDNDLGGPWCWVSLLESEHCDVPFCKVTPNCRLSLPGTEYVGTKSMTNSGRQCQRWDQQSPHSHTFTNPSLFPDDSLEDASNYCRNPGGMDDDGPWCHTFDPDVRWEHCDVPVCQDCKTTAEGRDYGGTLSTTVSGNTCQAWSLQTPHPHLMTDPNRFPDHTVADASNYCRNPDDSATGPWCYTTNVLVERERCDIPMCTGNCDTEEGHPVLLPKVRHVVHIGVDGLKSSCFRDAVGGAANIMSLAAEGSWTLDKGRTVYHTVSSPAWSTHVCAMQPEDTGVTGNSWTPPWRGYRAVPAITPVTGSVTPFPCYHQTLKGHDQNIQTAYFHDWDWLRFTASYGMPGTLDKDYYCQYENTAGGYPACDAYLVENATEYLSLALTAAPQSYTFIYLADVDNTGHGYGWCGAEYLLAVAVADSQVGEILDGIEASGAVEDTLVILSTDHGGTGYSHGYHADSDIIIPMFVRGPGVKINYEFQHVVRVQDIVPTALYAMGLKPNPFWTGRPMYEAFEEFTTTPPGNPGA